jgi:hypothetical protein
MTRSLTVINPAGCLVTKEYPQTVTCDEVCDHDPLLRVYADVLQKTYEPGVLIATILEAFPHGDGDLPLLLRVVSILEPHKFPEFLALPFKELGEDVPLSVQVQLQTPLSAITKMHPLSQAVTVTFLSPLNEILDQDRSIAEIIPYFPLTVKYGQPEGKSYPCGVRRALSPRWLTIPSAFHVPLQYFHVFRTMWGHVVAVDLSVGKTVTAVLALMLDLFARHIPARGPGLKIAPMDDRNESLPPTHEFVPNDRACGLIFDWVLPANFSEVAVVPSIVAPQCLVRICYQNGSNEEIAIPCPCDGITLAKQLADASQGLFEWPQVLLVRGGQLLKDDDVITASLDFLFVRVATNAMKVDEAWLARLQATISVEGDDWLRELEGLKPKGVLVVNLIFFWLAERKDFRRIPHLTGWTSERLGRGVGFPYMRQVHRATNSGKKARSAAGPE